MGLETIEVWNTITEWWPQIVSAITTLGSVIGGVTAIASAVRAFVRRPKSAQITVDLTSYLEDQKLLSPPLKRPAYSDRMAYVLAELADLAYYQFENTNALLNDAIRDLKQIELEDETSVREFLDSFAANMMSGKRINPNRLSSILQKSGFTLVDTINVKGTQGFVCIRDVKGEQPYVVISFRGTEKKISDWLTDARCVPTIQGNCRIHTGFLEAFTKEKDSEGKTTQQVVEEILSRDDVKEGGEPLPLFITGHSLGGALALLATKLVAPNVTGACYTFGAPRVANYEYFRLMKTPVYRIVNSSDIVPRVPPGAGMFVLVGLCRGLAWMTSFAPPVSALFAKVEEFIDKLSGYRHHGDLKYLTDVATGRFDTVLLLSNPPAIDRLVWMWRRIGKSFLIPVKSHSMEIYRKKLHALARTRVTN